MSPPTYTASPSACHEASNRVWRSLAAEKLHRANLEPYGYRVRSLVATWQAQGMSPEDVRAESQVQRRGDLIVVRSRPHWPWRVVSS
jgi:hypothetical protein